MGEPIQSFKELRVYQVACDLDYHVFLETNMCPREEKYSLVDQIRRSSRAVGANLAESWAKRRYPAHFLSKLTDADGELQETLHWISSVAACCYLSEGEVRQLTEHADSVGRLLGSTINNYQSF